MKVGALVLAAGKASRFGAAKQLLELDGITLIDRACLTALAAGCSPVLRVIGGHAGAILARPSPAGVETLHHSGWEEGMGNSLAAGVKHLVGLVPDLEAIAILLPDQPAVDAALLERVFDALEPPQISIVLCDHSRASGPPALFSACHFGELMALEGDAGAKSVAARYPQQVNKVLSPETAHDIDSPEAWERFTQARATNS